MPKQEVDPAVAQSIQRDVFSKIKHVIYIIRENRTYDQVFGDLGIGNGDPTLTLFGRERNAQRARPRAPFRDAR